MHDLILAAWSLLIWTLASIPAGIAVCRRLRRNQPPAHCKHTRSPR